LYANLIKKTSVPGNQDADTTRATYFAGNAAMVVWSSFLLDELAGLRKDALPTCPQCKKDPQWLAKNTGILTDCKAQALPTRSPGARSCPGTS
jgi:multiple sugar transport system substrate-binding protein